jgi:hypothetical protein
MEFEPGFSFINHKKGLLHSRLRLFSLHNKLEDQIIFRICLYSKVMHVYEAVAYCFKLRSKYGKPPGPVMLKILISGKQKY